MMELDLWTAIETVPALLVYVGGGAMALVVVWAVWKAISPRTTKATELRCTGF